MDEVLSATTTDAMHEENAMLRERKQKLSTADADAM
jgi:hypothetical protein